MKFDDFLNNVAVSWFDVLVVVLDGLYDFEAKPLVELDRLFVAGLHVEVNVVHMLLLSCIDGELEHLGSDAQPTIWSQHSERHNVESLRRAGLLLLDSAAASADKHVVEEGQPSETRILELELKEKTQKYVSTKSKPSTVTIKYLSILTGLTSGTRDENYR